MMLLPMPVPPLLSPPTNTKGRRMACKYPDRIRSSPPARTRPRHEVRSGGQAVFRTSDIDPSLVDAELVED